MKKQLALQLLLFLKISFCVLVAKAQDTTSFQKKLAEYRQNYPIEKVHLHLDKSYYSAGDDIWFKAYVLDDSNEIPSLISGVLYVDLFAENNKIIKRLKLPLLNGVTWGDFKLPANLTSGNYTVYAYTQWMKNEDPDSFFKKRLPIISNDGKTLIPNKLKNNDIDLQFFPEGGTLVESLPSKIAFKAVNSLGLGEPITGAVYDNEGIEIVKLENSYLGMGQFLLTPIAGKVYTAKIKLADQTEQTFRLPLAKPTGHALSVNTSNPDKFIIKVLTSLDQLGKDMLTVIVHHNGKPYFEYKVPTDRQIATVSLPLANLPTGIVGITLLNNNLPVCERVAFNLNTQKKMDLAFEGLAKTYTKRSPIDIELSATKNKLPVQASLSISVLNSTLSPTDLDNETHILSSLLLKSDLTGWIERPNSYFSDNQDLNRQRLENLMLTQGSRKINWSTILADTILKAKFSPEKAIKISGTVKRAGKQIPNVKVWMISTPKITFSKETTTDINGHFSFGNLNFLDSTSFIINAITAEDNNGTSITIDDIDQFIIKGDAKNGSYIETIDIESVKRYQDLREQYINNQKIQDPSNSQTLKTVEITEKVNKAPNSANFNGAGKADAVFGEDDLKNSISLTQYLQGRVSGIELYNGSYFLTRNNPGMESPIKINKPQPMQIYVNGTRVDEISANLDDVPITDVESVEILKSISNTFLYGTTDGVILITTKTANIPLSKEIGNKRNSSILTITPKGYTVNREFYSPKYNIQPDHKPDYRSTVFWEPNLITDKDGKANISYFNTDVPGIYRMVVEGIDAEGNLARKVLTYEVK